MKQCFWILFCFLFSLPINAQHPLTEQICSRLDSLPNCFSLIEFRVTQPMNDEEVIYYLQTYAERITGDTLSDYNYFIQVDSASHPSAVNNFYTYAAGHYYDLSGQRLREYHADQNSRPFCPPSFRGEKNPGVHQSGLFAREAPLMLTQLLHSFLSDSCFQIEERAASPENGRHYDEISAKRYINGEVVRRAILHFDPKTGLPVRKEIENSPDKLGSQTLIALYSYPEVPSPSPARLFNQQQLMAEKQAAFSTYRDNPYQVRQQTGKPMRAFRLPQTEDNTLFKSESLAGKAALLIFVKSNCSFCDSTLLAVSQFPKELNSQLTPIALFTDQNPDSPDEIKAATGFSGKMLYSASSTAVEYGVVSYPTLCLVDSNGVVIKIIEGYNRKLTDLLISALSPEE